MNEEISKPSQLIMLGPSTATSVDVMADGIIQSVKEGEQSPLPLFVNIKALEMVIERVKKELKPELMNEVDKYPEKDFEFAGNKISKAEHGTKYDYSKCGHPKWVELAKEKALIIDAMNEVETFLKTVKSPFTMVDESTGEGFLITPPTKTSVSGINISIK